MYSYVKFKAFSFFKIKIKDPQKGAWCGGFTLGVVREFTKIALPENFKDCHCTAAALHPTRHPYSIG